MRLLEFLGYLILLFFIFVGIPLLFPGIVWLIEFVIKTAGVLFILAVLFIFIDFVFWKGNRDKE